MKYKSTNCGFVALLGEPNVGKSTLVNALTGSKVSIVTHKAQTTRDRVRGILVKGSSQIVFVDTPGVFSTMRNRLEESMVSSAWGGAKNSDIILFVIEANRGVTDGTKSILASLQKVKNLNAPVVLILNKIDRVKREQLLVLSKNLNRDFNFSQTFMISALKSFGIHKLLNWLAVNLPQAPWLYPEHQLADYTSSYLASEITREKVLLRLHQEVPYQLAVETESWIDLPDGSGIRIQQIVVVGRKRYKKIVLGSKGETIKWISIAARKELEKMFDKRIHLFLRVQVKENWYNEKSRFNM